ncbi:MAG: hypothetical protein ACI4CY_05240 [Candidatus Gastranaerophilaceae bacterium]
MKTENIASFDPGIGDLFTNAAPFVYGVRRNIESMPSYKRKKLYFNSCAKSLVKLLLNNYYFHKGCLAWAKYLKTNLPGCKIENNPFINLDEQSLTAYNPAEYSDFNLEFIDAFLSDLKYYNLNISLPDDMVDVTNIYRDFVVQNEGFINTETTDMLIIPENFTMSKTVDDAYKLIMSAVENKNLDLLADL